jgi:hypothetical protein
MTSQFFIQMLLCCSIFPIRHPRVSFFC